MIKQSKGELAKSLAEAELKILNLKKKNKQLAKELGICLNIVDREVDKNNELQSKYDDLLDELHSQTTFGNNGN